MNVFPESWADRLKALTLSNECTVQMASISNGNQPESRTVLLRYLESKDALFIANNMTLPKWDQVNRNPNIAFSTYIKSESIALRLKAKGECFDNETEFTRLGWESMPQLHRDKYIAWADSYQGSGVSPIYGCIKLHPQSWILDEVGEDGWIAKRRIFNWKNGAWEEEQRLLQK